LLPELSGSYLFGPLKEVGFTFSDAFSLALAFIIGYAGGDFIENIYKIIIKKSSLYQE
jgi:hypothetical protein